MKIKAYELMPGDLIEGRKVWDAVLSGDSVVILWETGGYSEGPKDAKLEVDRT